MRHYIQMTTQFVKIINLFPVLDQIVEEEDTLVDPRYDVVANFPMPLIDQSEEEVNDLDIVTKLIENRTRQWVDAKIAQLKLQGAILTYGELEDELNSKIDSGAIAPPTEEAPKSPPATRSRKRKQVSEHQRKHTVYTQKAL